MNGEYPIIHGQDIVGKARVSEEGLYLRIRAEILCGLKQIVRLQLLGGEEPVNLGIPVPEGEGMVLNTRISRKRVTTENPQFCIQGKQERKEVFYPIRPGEPFSALSKLTEGHLSVRNDEYGLAVDQSASSSPTGQ